MKVKCWRCGAENDSENQWCISCATLMTDTRDGEEIDLTAPGSLTNLLRNIGKMILRSSVLALVVMGVIAAVVGIYDIIVAQRILVGIGDILFWTGIFLTFSSFFSGRMDPKSMVLTGYRPVRTRRPYGIFYRTVINPMMKSMRIAGLGVDENLLAIQMIAGLMVSTAGACIVVLLQ